MCFMVFFYWRIGVGKMFKKVLVVIVFLLVLFSGSFFFCYLSTIDVTSVDYELNGKEITAVVTLKGNTKHSMCSILGQDYSVMDHVCRFSIPNEETEVFISNRWKKKSVMLNPNKNEVLDFSISMNKIYLVVGESKTIVVTTEEIGSPNLSAQFVSENEGIAKTSNNAIFGVGAGTTKVHVNLGNLSKEIDVVVTDLLVRSTLNKNKESLTCGIYSEEQNRLLDEFLEYRVNQAGLKTRGAVVAVSRFLTLEFPYKIDYFFENGRLHNNTGGPQCDGEGRFYHKGLYLHSYKFADLDSSKVRWGPVTWGCPLLNWEDDGKYVYGKRYPNGLDCSGLVTWILYNAGYDPKDVGAGDTAYVNDDLGDFGPHIPITRSLLEGNTLKVGDIIGCNGHSALIGGLAPGHVYVVESTTYWDGVVMHDYTYDELLRMPFLTYVINMDEYYQEEGNYTDFWE